jgi:hypothetical protein
VLNQISSKVAAFWKKSAPPNFSSSPVPAGMQTDEAFTAQLIQLRQSLENAGDSAESRDQTDAETVAVKVRRAVSRSDDQTPL